MKRCFAGVIPDTLGGIDLDLPQGSFVAVEGRSGSGKSTLLNIVGLLDAPDSGSYSIDGSDTRGYSVSRATMTRSDTFAFIFQSFHLLERRSVLDSVEMGLLYRRVPATQRRRLALEALGQVGLAGYGDRRSSLLSGGERQRVAIARALACGAPVIVADEPTGNLDPESSRRVVECLTAANKAGRTVVLVTHAAEVAAEAQWRFTLRDGKHEAVEGDAPQRQGLSPRVDVMAPPPGTASRVAFTDMIRDAHAAVMSRPGRSSGLVLAIAVGVSLAVATLGVSQSAKSQVDLTFDAHANRSVTASWAEGDLSPAASQSQLKERMQGLAGVQEAGLLRERGETPVQPNSARPVLLVTEFEAEVSTLRAAEAKIRWAAGQPVDLTGSAALVGKSLARQLELSPIDSSPTITVDGCDRVVVGLVESSTVVPGLASGVVVPNGDANMSPDVSSQVTAILKTTPGAAQQVSRQIAVVIDPFTPETVQVNAPPDPSSLRAEIEADVRTTLVAFTIVALLASVAGVGNAMVLSVLERRQEYGLRRAVGAQPRHILALVMTEACLIGVVGGVVGLGLGIASVLAVTIAQHWVPVFDFSLAPLALAAGAAVGALGGIVAAARASRVLPHEALRQ